MDILILIVNISFKSQNMSIHAGLIKIAIMKIGIGFMVI